jgi:ABC-type sugar transport system permease subunit
MRVTRPAIAKPGRLRSKQGLTAYLLLAPGLLMYVPFHFVPIIGVFFLSLVSWKGYSFATIRWAGAGNYLSMLRDQYFGWALWHNIQFVVIVVVVQTVIALSLAMLLERKPPGSNFFRGIYFMPTVLSLVVVGLLFNFVLSPSHGLLNSLLRLLGARSTPVWLGDSKIALFILMVVHMWKEFGLSMFLFIAGLETIPLELFDAAKVDGAGPWKVFRNVILPLLKETTTVVVILSTINCFKLFDLVMVMTKGGPFFATEVLATRMYTQSFKYGKIGYGSAIAIVLFVITFLISVAQFNLRNRGGRVEY